MSAQRIVARAWAAADETRRTEAQAEYQRRIDQIRDDLNRLYPALRPLVDVAAQCIAAFERIHR